MIDHTLLKPEATADDVGALCAEAEKLHVYAVCVSPTMVARAALGLRGSQVKVAAVIGFPSGAHRIEVKADEALRAAGDGADEADMVINLGLALAGDWDGVRAEISAVRAVLVSGQILKVIIESAALSSAQITTACRAAEAGGADFVKSSTGFHPAGGARPEDIRIMAAAVGGRLGVKAAGGIHDAATAMALIDAGATRLGMSSTATVLAGIGRPTTQFSHTETEPSHAHR
ncbi:MAG: deoxyribose-phosphate aldolase [Actinomycetota bacterium]|nr:deoxyribose-phosphate aldolase [Actinomycetota bacterium]